MKSQQILLLEIFFSGCKLLIWNFFWHKKVSYQLFAELLNADSLLKDIINQILN